MAEVILCPACDNRDRQERLGFVRLDEKPDGDPPALYRCCECSYLYTMPKLEKPREA